MDNMSSSKRRKVDAPSSTRSAVSAIAARRRLQETASISPDVMSAAEDEPGSSAENAFSLLSSLKGGSMNSSSMSKNIPTNPKRGQNERRKAESDVQSSGKSTPSKTVVHSSFRLNKSNSRTKSDGCLELRLDEGERFVLVGSYGIKVISGIITICGAKFLAGQAVHRVHAPLCHAIPVIRTITKCQIQIHHEKIKGSLKSLGKLSPLYRGIWNELGEEPKKSPDKDSSFRFILAPEDVPKRYALKELYSPAEWNKQLVGLIDSTLRAERGNDATLVCGPKSAGKSTFTRLLTNRLLTCNISETKVVQKRQISSIVVLDLDPGQPEYAPVGTISLVHIKSPNLGSPFSHTSLEDSVYQVVRCHTIASPSPASDPELYLECAADLYDTYRRTLRSCPLIINTPGWILGTGLDLISELISRIIPANVVYMSEDGPADTVESFMSATKGKFFTLPSYSQDVNLRTAAHLRAMQTMSYFHASVESSAGASSRQTWVAQSLSSIRPWQLRYAGTDAGIRGILCYDYQAPTDLVVDAINGMILAAVEVVDQKAFRELCADGSQPQSGQSSNIPEAKIPISYSPEQLPIITNPNDISLDPCYSRLIGLVLVRGIDVLSKDLHIITPIASETIGRIKSQGHDIVLVYGKFETPTWAYTEDIYDRSNPSEVSIMEEASSDVESETSLDQVGDIDDTISVPWVEVLRGNEKRPVGSQAWRVRRDLGRHGGGE